MSDYVFFEDLSVGDSWKSPARTMTETDIVSFAGMTGDYDPLHVDHEFAAQTPYGKPIAHGLLGLSLLAGLSSTAPRMRTIALVRIDQWSFQRPINVGDTVHVVTEVVSLTQKGRKSGEVEWLRKLVNQKGEVTQSGHLTTLVSSRSFLPRKKAPADMKLAKLRETAASKITGGVTTSESVAEPAPPHEAEVAARASDVATQ